MSPTIHHRIAAIDGEKNRAEIALAALEACDPHAALGVSGRRIQRVIEDCRNELDKLRDVRVFSRFVGGAA